MLWTTRRPIALFLAASGNTASGHLQHLEAPDLTVSHKGINYLHYCLRPYCVVCQYFEVMHPFGRTAREAGILLVTRLITPDITGASLNNEKMGLHHLFYAFYSQQTGYLSVLWTIRCTSALGNTASDCLQHFEAPDLFDLNTLFWDCRVTATAVFFFF